MRIRRTKEELAAGLTLEQVKAARTQHHEPVSPKGWSVDPNQFIELLRDAPWDGGHCEYAARCIEYLLGERTQEEFERDHPTLFKKAAP